MSVIVTNGTSVDLGGGLSAMREVAIQGVIGDCLTTVAARVVGQRYECVAFTMSGGVISTRSMRDVAITQLLNRIDEAPVFSWGNEGSATAAAYIESFDDRYEKVAAIYRVRYATQGSIRAAIEAEFGCAHATAARWVAVARERGLLSDVGTPGRACP